MSRLQLFTGAAGHDFALAVVCLPYSTEQLSIFSPTLLSAYIVLEPILRIAPHLSTDEIISYRLETSQYII